MAISFCCLQNVNGGKGGFSESVNTTMVSQASTSAPVPAVTLIHHDGNQVSTVKQIVSMEGLKEILHKHEKVKLDDPQVALQIADILIWFQIWYEFGKHFSLFLNLSEF